MTVATKEYTREEKLRKLRKLRDLADHARTEPGLAANAAAQYDKLSAQWGLSVERTGKPAEAPPTQYEVKCQSYCVHIYTHIADHLGLKWTKGRKPYEIWITANWDQMQAFGRMVRPALAAHNKRKSELMRDLKNRMKSFDSNMLEMNFPNQQPRS